MMKLLTRDPINLLCLGMWIMGIAILYIPIMTLISYSFVNAGDSLGFGLDAYIKLFSNLKMKSAIVTSVSIAGISSTIATTIGGLAAIGLDKVRDRAQVIIKFLTFMPLILPEVVFGLGLLVWFVFLRINLGQFSLILAHVTFSVSYVLLTVLGRVQTIDDAIANAGRDLGANSWQIFTKIQIPLLFPALISGWMMSFTLSFDDFLISFFTSGPDTVTLPLALYSSIKFGVSPEIFAMASCIFAVSFIGALIVSKISGSKNFA
jgi:spermidine/putrescine transport system permease protein